MNRLQKKCFVFSLGLHGSVAALILLASAGFRDRPQTSPPPTIMSIIPANIVDRAVAGGASPAVTLNQPPQQLRPAAPPAPLQRAQPPAPRQTARVEHPRPEPQRSDDVALQPAPRIHKTHEIHTSYELVSHSTSNKKPETNHSRESSMRDDARRRKEIQESLDQLVSGVKNIGAPSTTVEIGGSTGGEAFASYRDVIFNAYYHAWITPDSVTDRTASVDAKVTIARDGTILSAEIVRPSGNVALDKSVERALRFVTKLPPFPASARDEERTFKIQFSLEAKDTSG